ncbi:Crp/Fnr family transcriptional regulator [Parabacteroides distasonis]|uniref:Crp/Fnr family transcriptional regulator n=3 Tax=Parabacteroides TaxID=375288 RepID=UPI0022E05BDB|nr:Crp/Fnr family transcriptional regulator [Parabacteroides distasonis]
MKEEVRQKVMERFSISEQAMRLLLESAEMMSFVPKDIIVHEGEINTNMYILSKGIWRAYTFKDGTEDTFWFAVESEIALPVWGYTSGSPSLYTIEAVTESEAYCLSKQKLEILFQSSVQLANIGRRILENFMLEIETSWLSSYKRTAIERYAILLDKRTAIERYAILLDKRTAIERYAILLDKQPEIIQSVPLKYIASYLGVTAQSLSRIRAKLASSLTFIV